jgi:hypothetical protein
MSKALKFIARKEENTKNCRFKRAFFIFSTFVSEDLKSCWRMKLSKLNSHTANFKRPTEEKQRVKIFHMAK